MCTGGGLIYNNNNSNNNNNYYNSDIYRGRPQSLESAFHEGLLFNLQ